MAWYIWLISPSSPLLYNYNADNRVKISSYVQTPPAKVTGQEYDVKWPAKPYD